MDSQKFTLNNHDFERMGMLLLHAVIATVITNVLQIVLHTSFGGNTDLVWGVTALISKGLEQYLTGTSPVKTTPVQPTPNSDPLTTG